MTEMHPSTPADTHTVRRITDRPAGFQRDIILPSPVPSCGYPCGLNEATASLSRSAIRASSPWHRSSIMAANSGVGASLMTSAKAAVSDDTRLVQDRRFSSTSCSA